MFHYGKSSNFITSFRPFNIHLSNLLLVYPTLFATPYLIILAVISILRPCVGQTFGGSN